MILRISQYIQTSVEGKKLFSLGVVKLCLIAIAGIERNSNYESPSGLRSFGGLAISLRSALGRSKARCARQRCGFRSRGAQV